MEALCATFSAESPAWFCSEAPDADGSGSEDDHDADENVERARALAARQSVACIRACVRWLELAISDAPPGANDALRNCNALWRAKFKAWQEPCGNHLNVPDLLFVAGCHLRVVLMPAATRPYPQSPDAIAKLRAGLEHALREWNRAPSALHTEYASTTNACARAIVMWGSRVAPVRLVDTTLSPEDVSMLTMNVNVHQNLDNRARNTDLQPVAAAATPAPEERKSDPEELLQNFVCLASRYAFFTSLHIAARRAATIPQTELHRRVAAEAVRPPIEFISANIAKLPAVFCECSRTSLPEFVHREINYTIWKWTLSVGAMEVCVRVCVRARAPMHLQAFLRMTPTIEWHKLNPVTVSIKGTAAATLPGSLVRAVAISDYGAVDNEWPEHVRQCHRDVWHLTLWHQLFTEIDMHFLDDYVVLAHDIRHKSAVIGRSKLNLHPRRPVVVRACATWCVHAHSLVWHTDTLEECLYLWAWLIVHFFDGRDERGASLQQILNRIGLSFY